MHRPADAPGATTPHAQAARLPSNKNFQKFCGIIDRGKMATDPRFEGGGCYLIVARMSAATSEVFAFAMVPAYRCAHAGYLLRGPQPVGRISRRRNPPPWLSP
jgi:hypothetical protein